MNFALMFALALGIDYALFLVVRFRGARFGRHEDDPHAVAETMDTAGKAVLFSGLTVLISLSAVMLVPSPAFRSMALGIMLSVVFVLAATLTLLPAVLARLGKRVDGLALPWVHAGEHRSPRFARWAERLWRRPVAYGLASRSRRSRRWRCRCWGCGPGCRASRSSPRAPRRASATTSCRQAFGPGAPGALQVVTPTALRRLDGVDAEGRPGRRRGDAGDAVRRTATCSSCRPCRRSTRRRRRSGHTVDRLRADLPAPVARRRRGGGEPRPRAAAVGEDPAGDRRRAGARVPAAARRAAGAAHRRARRGHQPARGRRGVRRRPADLPGRARRRGCSASSRRASSTRGRRCSSSR